MSSAFECITLLVDFWTTKCTRCPEALDDLNSIAGRESFSDVRFVSICCDELDGARNIIEKDDEPKWGRISHFYMDDRNKEKAKEVLGFKSVPFYVVLNERGEILQKGGKRDVDLELIGGIKAGDGEYKGGAREFDMEADF